MERPQSGAASRPRSGAGKKPGSAASKPPANGAKAVEELLQKVELLERQLSEEARARNLAQLERDKIQAFWDITKRELEEARGAARLAARGLEDAQDAHALELKVYRQKVKHLLFEHQSNVARVRAEGEAALGAQAARFAQQEGELAGDKRALRARIREQELSGEELLKQFRLDNAKQVAKLRQEFELQVRQVQLRYEAQLKELQEGMEHQHSAEVSAVEQRRSAHVSSLMASHEAAFKDMRSYYQQITASNLDLIKALKEEMREMKAAEARQDKLMAEVVRENKRLAQPLAQALAEAEALRAKLAGAERDRAALAASKARLAAGQRSLKSLEWECEVLRQQLEAAEGRSAGLRAAFEGAVADAARGSGLHAALQQRRRSSLVAQAAVERASEVQRSSGSGGPRPGSSSMQAGVAGGVLEADLLPAGLPAEAAAEGTEESTTGATADGQAKQQQSCGPSAVDQPPSAAPAAGKQPAAEALPPVGSPDWALAMLAAALRTPLPDPDADIVEGNEAAEILGEMGELEKAQEQERVLGGVHGPGAGAGSPAPAHQEGGRQEGACCQEGTEEAGSWAAGGKAAGLGGAVPSWSAGAGAGLLAGLEGKLSQAAQYAMEVVAEAAAGSKADPDCGGTIPAVRSRAGAAVQ